jgi:hypothetical protein
MFESMKRGSKELDQHENREGIAFGFRHLLVLSKVSWQVKASRLRI